MSCTVQQLLSTARSQLGVIETPVNRTRYGAWFGLDGNSWCAMFVSYVANEVGALDIIPKHAYTPTGANWFRARGQFDMNPRVGDIVYFQWPGSPRICHVGIVESVRPDGRVVTIEGNSQPGESGNQSNGGGVYRRVRARSFIKGFGHPQYVSESANAAELKSNPVQPAPGLAIDGDWGRATTMALQSALGVKADGDFGPVSVAALQRKIGAKADGQFGPKSKAALQRFLGVKTDGDIGPITISAMQARLNAHTF